MRAHSILPGLLLLVHTACTNQAPTRRSSPLDGLARIAAIETSPRAVQRRLTGLGKVRDRIADDIPDFAPARAVNAFAGEAARASRPLDRGQRLFARELARAPTLPTALLPSSSTLGQHLADGLGRVGELLLPARPMLPDRADRRHRTDPADDRPEAGWWQRLRRRLRL